MFTRLTNEERCTIDKLFNQERKSIRKISNLLNRSPSTISRELKRNCKRYGVYDYETAQKKKLNQEPNIIIQYIYWNTKNLQAKWSHFTIRESGQ